VLGVLKQSTRAEVYIVVDNKPDFHVILWVRSWYLWSGGCNWCLFLHLQDFGELLATSARLEEGRWDDQAFKFSFILVIILRFRKRR
jgi:hypothetical protein